jgi:hypothetical protein
MQTLRKIQPLHANLTPPAGSVPIMVTPTGKQVYRLTRQRSRAVPVYENGERAYKRNANGDRYVALNTMELYEETLTFYLESDGNNNIQMVPWSPPTEAELAEAERQRKIAEMGGGRLGEALVDANLTPEQVLAALAERPAAPQPQVEYPVHKGFGKWTLSNGSEFAGTKEDAHAAEAALHATTDTTPEF